MIAPVTGGHVGKIPLFINFLITYNQAGFQGAVFFILIFMSLNAKVCSDADTKMIL